MKSITVTIVAIKITIMFISKFVFNYESLTFRSEIRTVVSIIGVVMTCRFVDNFICVTSYDRLILPVFEFEGNRMSYMLFVNKAWCK